MSREITPIVEQTHIEYYSEKYGHKMSATILGHYLNSHGQEVYILQPTTMNGNLESVIMVEMSYIHKNVKMINEFKIK